MIFPFYIHLGTFNVTSSKNWTESLHRCTIYTGSYLTGNISLADATQACKDAKQNDITPRWVGVVKDIYVNYDKGIHDITF